MKTKPIIFFFIIIFSFLLNPNLFSQQKLIQDTIITKNNDVIACEIKLIEGDFVSYILTKDTNDVLEKVMLIKYKDVFMIKRNNTLFALNDDIVDTENSTTINQENLKRIETLSDSIKTLYNTVNIAGASLERGANTYYTGVALIVGGGLLGLAGASAQSGLLVLLSIAAEITGGILTIVYMSSIKDAGILMQTIK